MDQDLLLEINTSKPTWVVVMDAVLWIGWVLMKYIWICTIGLVMWCGVTNILRTVFKSFGIPDFGSRYLNLPLKERHQLIGKYISNGYIKRGWVGLITHNVVVAFYYPIDWLLFVYRNFFTKFIPIIRVK
jgi:hypothetical protein